jgi:hypothetical protein
MEEGSPLDADHVAATTMPPGGAHAAASSDGALERSFTPYLPIRSVQPDLPLFGAPRLVRHEVSCTHEPKRGGGSSREASHPGHSPVCTIASTAWLEACSLPSRETQGAAIADTMSELRGHPTSCPYGRPC